MGDMLTYRYCPCCAGTLVQKKIDRKKRLVCSQCGFILYRNSKPAVGALILEGETILLTLRAFEPFKGYWDIPGGFLEPGESPENGLKRELREELGLRCKVQVLYKTGIDRYGKTGDFCLTLYYLVKSIGKIKRVADDVSDYAFFPLDKLPRNLAFPSARKVLAELRELSPIN